MKINQIRAGMDGVTVTGRISYIGIKKIVKTKFGEAPVARAILEDDTGRIALNLWRGQIDLVKEGDVVRVENGFVRTYRDQLELNVGSRGRIVILSRSKPSV
jgi:replication factor A1